MLVVEVVQAKHQVHVEVRIASVYCSGWLVQANKQMAQAVSSREAEAHYPVLLDDVMRLVSNLNTECKQAVLL